MKKTEVIIYLIVAVATILSIYATSIPSELSAAIGTILCLAYRIYRTQAKKERIPDEELPDLPEKNENKKGGTVMKFLVVALAAGMLFTAQAKAESPSVYLKLGSVDFVYPLAHVDASPYLHDFITDENLVGADMWLASYPNKPTMIRFSDYIRFIPNVNIPINSIHLNAGCATSLKATNIPYVSVSVNLLQIITNAPTFVSYISIGFDHDFRDPDDVFFHPLLGTTIPFY